MLKREQGGVKMSAASLMIRLTADTAQLEKNLQSASTKIKNFGTNMTSIGTNMTKRVTAPIVLAGAGLAKAAMDLEATEAKYATVFAGMTKEADAFIKEFQKLTPATTAEARSMASGIQDLLVPLGFARDEATTMTAEFMHVAGALTNFNSATHSAADVTNALQSAITGSTEPLKRLGIQLDVATIEQKALEMGLIETKDEMTKQIRAQVILAEVYSQSGDALEAYTEANLDAKTELLLLKSEIVDVAAEMGTMLLPIIKDVVAFLRVAVDWFGSLTKSQQRTILIVGALVAAIGPLLMGLGLVITSIGALIPLFALLLGPIGAAIVVVAALTAAWLIWGDDIKRITAQAIEWVVEKFNYLKTLPATLKQVGIDIVAGLWSGISERISWLQDQVKNFASGIANTIKSFFGIASPSKLMEGYGENLSKGLALGVQNKAGIAINAVREVGSAMAEEANKAVANLSLWQKWGEQVKSSSTAARQQAWADRQNMRSSGMTTSDMIKNLQSFDSGGVVQGAIGSPQLVIAHAGETILPTHKGGVSREVNVNIYGNDPYTIGQQVVRVLREQGVN